MSKYSTVLFLLVGILPHIPLYIPITELNIFFSFLINKITFQLLVFLFLIRIYVKQRTMISLVSSIIIMLTIIFYSTLNDIENNLIIRANQTKISSKEFHNPFLGYKQIEGFNCIRCKGEVTFIYNEGFGSYKALVYKKDHGIEEKAEDTDASVVKVINKNWWVYKELD